MSLTFEQFVRALERCRKMRGRLEKLIGFDPSTSNHYGQIHLYNQRIDLDTSDEEILEIREKYLRWKNEILGILSEYGCVPDDDELSAMFSFNYMFGTMYFLEIPVDINKGADAYRESISEYVKRKKTNVLP